MSNIHNQIYLEATPFITGVEPIFGVEGTFVTIKGLNFVKSQLLVCIFKDSSAPAMFLNNKKIVCRIPRGLKAKYLNVLSLIITANKKAYHFKSDWFRLHQSQLSYQKMLGHMSFGGNSITIFGTGFIDSSMLTCSIGMQTVHAVYLNASAVRCTIPKLQKMRAAPRQMPLDIFEVDVKVANNGQNYGFSVLVD